jgi:hypothetical protein
MSPRSLLKDSNDKAALHSPGFKNSASGRGAHFHEIVPLFYTRTGCPVPLEGSFRGAHAFLIANGPSLLELDLKPLKARWCMTMNNGAKTFRANANITVDEPARFSFSTWLDPTIMKFMPMAHFEKPLWDNRLLCENGEWKQQWKVADATVGNCPNVIGFRRNEKFHAPRWLWEETINWGNHSKYGGGRSVMLAALRILFILGFRRVYLLGVDFLMTDSRRYHFAEQRTQAAVKGNMSTDEKLQQWFTELQPYFLKESFIVRNCNANSKLAVFPYISYEEALKESGSALGHVSEERTEGMYQVLEKKLAAARVETSNSETQESEEATLLCVQP